MKNKQGIKIIKLEIKIQRKKWLIISNDMITDPLLVLI